MRKTLSLLCLVALMAVVMPAQAQLRTDVRAQRAPAKLYDEGGSHITLNKLFSPEHFRMSHSYAMSFGSFGGNSSSLGLYTNSMQWQFNQKLAARVDVGFAHSPMALFGQQQGGTGLENGKLFLQNAEVAYRPKENVEFHLSIRQSPYGSYMGPYAYNNPFFFGSPFGYRQENLFWKDAGR